MLRSAIFRCTGGRARSLCSPSSLPPPVPGLVPRSVPLRPRLPLPPVLAFCAAPRLFGRIRGLHLVLERRLDDRRGRLRGGTYHSDTDAKDGHCGAEDERFMIGLKRHEANVRKAACEPSSIQRTRERSARRSLPLFCLPVFRSSGLPLPASRFPLPVFRHPPPAACFPLPASRFPLPARGLSFLPSSKPRDYQ